MRRKICLLLRSLWWRMKEIDCVPYTNQVREEMHAHLIAYMMFCFFTVCWTIKPNDWCLDHVFWMNSSFHTTGELLCTNGAAAACAVNGDIYIKSHLNVKKTPFPDSHVSLCVRWGVVVRREAARVYQQSNSATERDPETHRQSHQQCENIIICLRHNCFI